MAFRISAAMWIASLAVIGQAFSQDDAALEDGATEAGQPYQFAEGPETIDPATLVPEPLGMRATVTFDETPLKSVAQWIQENLDVPVLIDEPALTNAGIPAGEPVTDHLANEPVYLLLNRLSAFGLTWVMTDDVLQITTVEIADEILTTESYNVQDLLDAGISRDAVIITIQWSTDAHWQDIDGIGGVLEWLGDVLFIRTTARTHRQIKGLFAALRNHGKSTYTYDPPSHIELRQKLNQPISVDFDDTPLYVAIRDMAEQTQADIRLRKRSLSDVGISTRQPVSLTLADRQLGTVLRVLLSNMGLTWSLEDGVMWITTVEEADAHMLSVVFDVGDLCSDEDEAAELQGAIQDQTEGPWEDVDGIGGRIVFPTPKTMVVRQTEHGIVEVQALLANYRRALATSKRRKSDAIDPEEVLTRYYRLDAPVANDLEELLPRLVQPETWSINQPDAPGSILRVSSGSDLVDASGQIFSKGTESPANRSMMIVSKSVLIIRQQRRVHEQIAKVIDRVTHSDPPLPSGEDALRGGAGGIGGGGGFGGSIGIGKGYFEISDHAKER